MPVELLPSPRAMKEDFEPGHAPLDLINHQELDFTLIRFESYIWQTWSPNRNPPRPPGQGPPGPGDAYYTETAQSICAWTSTFLAAREQLN